MIDRNQLARALEAERAALNGKHPPAATGALEGWLFDEAHKLTYRPALDLVGLTESGAAHVLARNYGDRLRHTAGRGWLMWDGMRWTEQGGEAAARQAARVIAASYLLAAMEMPASSDRARDRVITLARRILTARGVDGVLKEAASLAPIRCADSDFDPDPWLLNTAAGIVGLRTGELRPHDPQAMMTRITGAPYDPQAEAPRWRQFLREVFADDAEIIGFVRRWLGYCLTGDMRAQRYLVAWGTGRNGKSVLFGTVRHVMGDYSTDIPTDALAMRHAAGQASPDIAKLPGVRLGISPEWSERVNADESLIKSIVGGDPVSTRFLFKNSFTFQPVSKLVIFGNERPVLRGTDTGTWRRPILLPFTQEFSGARADETLAQKLRAEAAGILADLVRACLEWQRDGLQVPSRLEEATQAWRADSNDVAKFISECCVRAPHASATVGQLHAEYVAWGGGLRTPRAFGRALDALGLQRKRTERGYEVLGLGLATR